MSFSLFKKSLKICLLGGVILLGFFAIGINIIRGESNLQIFFSGRLLDSEDVPVEEGLYNMEFSIYETATSTDSLWQEAFTEIEQISVVDGSFQVTLAKKNPINLDLENQTYWLGVSIGGTDLIPIWDLEMQPRIPIVSLKKLLTEGKVELSEEDFIQALIEEFEKNATSSDALTQKAFLRFLQEKITEGGTRAVIISPTTLNLLLEEILRFQTEKEQGFEEEQEEQERTLWQKVLDFLRRILETISRELAKIFSKISEIFVRLKNIEEGIVTIINLLQEQSDQPTQTAEELFPTQEPLTEPEYYDYDPALYLKENGTATIVPGEKTVRVFSNNITHNSEIFVDPAGLLSETWWVSQRVNGEFFEISISEPVANALLIGYWIVTPRSDLPQDQQQDLPTEEGGQEEPAEEEENPADTEEPLSGQDVEEEISETEEEVKKEEKEPIEEEVTEETTEGEGETEESSTETGEEENTEESQETATTTESEEETS